MLRLVGTNTKKRAAQRTLEHALKSALKDEGVQNIGYPGGNADHRIYAAGEGLLYCAFSGPNSDLPIPRYWNSFGTYRPGMTQQITVEINIPVDRNDGRVAGFFADDTETGERFLMHDGGIGGGRPGIGKEAFLDFINDELVPVIFDGGVRYGLAISSLDDPNLPALVWRFAQKVQAFKEAATTGLLGALPLSTDEAPNSEYFPEHWGRKKGKRSGSFDYISYHGMIVDQLKLDREKTLRADESIRKNRIVDLFVCKGDERAEVYEVKTSCDRQSLYTALGQLMIHGRNGAERILVLPSEDALPRDCREALDALGVRLRRFKLVGRGIKAQVEFIK